MYFFILFWSQFNTTCFFSPPRSFLNECIRNFRFPLASKCHYRKFRTQHIHLFSPFIQVSLKKKKKTERVRHNQNSVKCNNCRQPSDEDTSQEVSSVTSSIHIDFKTWKWKALIDWRCSGSY